MPLKEIKGRDIPRGIPVSVGILQDIRHQFPELLETDGFFQDRDPFQLMVGLAILKSVKASEKNEWLIRIRFPDTAG